MFLKFNYIACSPLLHIFFLLILVIKKRKTSTGDEPTFSYFAFLNIFQVNHKSFIKYLYFQPGFKYGYKKNIFLSSSEFIIQTTLFDTCNNIARVIAPFLHFDK